MKVSALAATALVASAWAAAPALALDEGVPDFGAHPNVGMMGFDVDGPGPEPTVAWCTGTVVSDRVFLTAAHCLTDFPAGTAFAVTLEPGAPATPMYKPGRIFDDFPIPLQRSRRRSRARRSATRGSATRRPTPTTSRCSSSHRGTFAGVTPVQLSRPGEFGRHRDLFTLVGYGGDPEWGDGEGIVVIAEGYRQRASAPFKRLTSTQLLLDGRSRVTGRGGACLGDSGSPQFFAGFQRAALAAVDHRRRLPRHDRRPAARHAVRAPVPRPVPRLAAAPTARARPPGPTARSPSARRPRRPRRGANGPPRPHPARRGRVPGT